jgi:Pup-ligase protein
MDRRIYGVETEYAIAQEGAERRLSAADPGRLFDLLEAAVLERFSTLEGDSFGRDPDRAHGSGIEIKEGRFLESGARFYYDTGHVEWATPECPSARQAALYELAGERTLAELAAGLAPAPGARLLLLKNNIDYAQQRTFGCHENYLVPRGSSKAADRALFDRLVSQLVPFLVTRQIFAGAGKLSTDDPGAPYQLSQRADFIQSVVSKETRSERGIINTRDESLGDAKRYRRLHLIVGDSNRSALANVLKLGTTGLVLQLIEAGTLQDVPTLADPVAAIREVSRDLTCRKPLPLAGGRRASALEVQGFYLEQAERAHRDQGQPPGETAEILASWRRVLEDLAADPVSTADRVDWMIKLHHLLHPRLGKAGVSWDEVGTWSRVFGELRKSRSAGQARLTAPSTEECARFQYLLDRYGLSWSDFERQHRLFFELRECDLRYHDIDPRRGLFALLDRAGLVKRPFEERELAAASSAPPASRASLRAEVIRWAHANGREQCTLLDWGRVAFPGARGAVELADPFATVHRELAHRLRGEEEIPIRILQVETAPGPIADFASRVRKLLGR